jgi:hypothetical protein
MSKEEQKIIRAKYKTHDNSVGGIFTTDKRRKLLGLKQKHGKYHEEGADFWYDVRSTVRSGLKDLELFFDVATPEQIEKTLEPMSIDEQKKAVQIKDPFEQEYYWKSFSSLKLTVDALFRDYWRIRHRKLSDGKDHPHTEVIDYDDSWKAILAEEILSSCLDFFTRNRYISTKAHMRLVDEMKDMINVEVSRGMKLKLGERTVGHA